VTYLNKPSIYEEIFHVCTSYLPDIKAVFVLRGYELHGIFTPTNFCQNVLASGKSHSSTACGEVDTKPVYTHTPDASVYEAMDMMTEHNITKVPVVPYRKHVDPAVDSWVTMGVLTDMDILKYFLHRIQ
jgi:signal-transduction protein with cAMP-binding, CBS, and nucleotidyltransferase domain